MDDIIENLELELGLRPEYGRRKVSMKPKPGPNNGLRAGYAKTGSIPQNFRIVASIHVPPSVQKLKPSNRQIKTKSGEVFIVKKWGKGKRFYKMMK